MSKRNKFLFILAGVISVLGFTTFVPIDKVFAQSSTNKINNSMVQMMKAYHGENWKQGCNDMMNDFDNST